jgi:rare lipoprotein A
MSRKKCMKTDAGGAMRRGGESAKTKTHDFVFLPACPGPRKIAIRSTSRTRTALAAFAIAALLTATACHKKVKPHVAIAPRIGATELGDASWYGYPYHGRRAANGEIYDMEKLTAAHRTLPFDTWVEVRNLTNEKMVTVRITDRGPFVDGRIIDLSRAAARAIDLIGPGVARVQLTIVAPPPPAEVPVVNLFAVQIGAFRERDRAERVREEYEREFGSAKVVYRAGAPAVWRVLVGQESSLDAANALLARVLEKTQPAFVVRLDDSAENVTPAVRPQ